jgi:DNA-binding beta-propeller fold protein YncE
MKFKHLYKVLLFAALSVLASASVCTAAFSVNYLYNLSNFNGVLPYSGGIMFSDKAYDELYVCSTQGVDIFNATGMEIYSFGGEHELGNIGGGAVDKTGNIMLLSTTYDYNPNGGSRNVSSLVLCNYRGEPISNVPLKGVPPEFSDCTPQQMVRRGGKIYLEDPHAMKVIVVDWTGKFLDGYDIAAILQMNDKKVLNSGLTGFNVDKDGNLFFTIAVFFRAYKLTPDRILSSWGQPGGAPGKLNIATAIDTDDKGNIYVVDILKAAVQVFDKNFNYVTMFGGRGWYDGGLIAPQHIMIDHKGLVYVSQSAERGVNVYKISN